MIESPPLSTPELGSCITSALQTIEDRLMEVVTSVGETINSPASHLVEAGGKRLHPILALLTAQLGGLVLVTTGEEICDTGAVVELTHIATLYHDDVMDKAPLRRGALNTQTMWGNSIATLTGDILAAQASQLAAALGPEAVMAHARTFRRPCMGQLHEALSHLARADPADHYIQVLVDKTGSLIAVSARYGVIFTGVGTRTEQIVEEFSEWISVAFQLADDIIDLTNDSATIGKTPGTDLREGVGTMPVLLLCKALAAGKLDAADRAILSRLSSGDLSDDVFLSDVIARLREHPILARTCEMAMDQTAQAVEGLGGLEEAILDGTRQRLAQADIEGEVATAAMTDVGERIRQVCAAMEDLVCILVDRVA